MASAQQLDSRRAGVPFALEVLDALELRLRSGEKVDACDLEEMLAFVSLFAEPDDLADLAAAVARYEADTAGADGCRAR